MLVATGVVSLVVMLVTVVVGISLLVLGVTILLTVVSSVFVDADADVISRVVVATSSVAVGDPPSNGVVVITETVVR